MAQQFTLADGRKLDYAINGAENGIPLLWFHGTPSGYPPIPSLAAACKRFNLTLITFSRPGYGNSSRRKGRKVIDGVADAEELLKHLGHEKCVVGGWSGGGPYALACATKLPGCIAAVAVASVAPYDAEGLDWLAGQGQDNVDETNASLQGEAELRTLVETQREVMLKEDVPGMVAAMTTILPEVDKKALLEDKDFGEFLLATTNEGLKTSANGWIDDDLGFVKPWGFDPKDVRVPLFLYHGSVDLMCPYAHGKWIASRIPEQHVKAHLYEDEGHISIFFGRVDDMLQELLGVASS